jgi:hypothetical protein
MRKLRLLLAAVVGALAVLVLAPGPAFACSCVNSGAEEYVDFADLVVVGTFEQHRPVPAGKEPDALAWTVAVDEVLEGQAPARMDVITPVSGASCGLEGVEPGRRYVVFASFQTVLGQDSEHPWATLCGGTGPATPAFLADVEEVTGPGEPPGVSAAYSSAVSFTYDEPVGAGLAVPLALAGGGVFVLLTGGLWLRLARS